MTAVEQAKPLQEFNAQRFINPPEIEPEILVHHAKIQIQEPQPKPRLIKEEDYCSLDSYSDSLGMGIKRLLPTKSRCAEVVISRLEVLHSRESSYVTFVAESDRGDMITDIIDLRELATAMYYSLVETIRDGRKAQSMIISRPENHFLILTFVDQQDERLQITPAAEHLANQIRNIRNQLHILTPEKKFLFRKPKETITAEQLLTHEITLLSAQLKQLKINPERNLWDLTKRHSEAKPVAEMTDKEVSKELNELKKQVQREPENIQLHEALEALDKKRPRVLWQKGKKDAKQWSIVQAVGVISSGIAVALPSPNPDLFSMAATCVCWLCLGSNTLILTIDIVSYIRDYLQQNRAYDRDALRKIRLSLDPVLHEKVGSE